jgi:hypothetical protein
VAITPRGIEGFRATFGIAPGATPTESKPQAA